MSGKILILEHRVYNDIADIMLKSVANCVSQQGMECDVIAVPRLRDLPVAVVFNEAAAAKSGQNIYEGYVLLGARLTTDELNKMYSITNILTDIEKVKLDKAVALGTGIVLADTEAEASAKAAETAREAAINCFKLLAIKRSLSV